ncbi:MAG: L,D-transpeptidase family protein [Halocynthiibacter sp.]
MTPQALVLTPQGIRFHGRCIPCSIGRGGIVSTKKEGDGGTPIGIHKITEVYYRPDRQPPPCSWAKPIGINDLWSDDVTYASYNSLVKAPYSGSHEHMRRSDPLYDIVLNTNWNWPNATPGKGSAIFLHIWRKPRHPTEGCIAFSASDLIWITQRLRPDNPLIIRSYL